MLGWLGRVEQYKRTSRRAKLMLERHERQPIRLKAARLGPRACSRAFTLAAPSGRLLRGRGVDAVAATRSHGDAVTATRSHEDAIDASR
jgi:hypothetical protein